MRLNIQLFAEGTINGSSTASNCDCRITWTSTSDVATNKSSVTANIQIYKSGSGSTTGTFSGSITINGSTKSVSKKFSPYNYGSWKTVGTYTVDVPHNTDGTKNCSISGSLTQTGTTMAGTYTASGTALLDDIPRASIITSITDGVTDYKPAVVWTPYDSSFRFKIKFSYGDWSYTTGFITPNTTSPYTYNSYTILGSNVASYMSHESEGFTATLYTYTATDLIGATTKNFRVTLNSSYKPTTPFTTFNISPTSTSVPNAWGIYVQGKSKASINIQTSASTGSTIVAYSIKLDGYTYTSTPNVVSNTLTSSGTLPIIATATDSRNRSSSDSTHSIYVYPYSVPTFNIAQVYRCDANGNQNDEGTYVYYNFKGSVSSCNGNNKGTYKIAYKVSTASTYSNEITIASNQQSLNTSGILSSGGTPITFSTTSSYDFKFTITDTFETNTNTQTIDTGFDLMNFNASGKAMAIGKVSEASSNQELLEVALPTELALGNYNAHYVNDSSNSGFVKAMQIVIKSTYIDTPLIFNVLGRANHWATYKVQFTGADSTDPNLNAFTIICDSGNNFNAYIKKISTSTWGVYVYVAGWARTEITNLQFTPRHDEKLSITYPFDDFTATRPTSGITNASYEVLMCNIRNIYQENKDDENGYTFYPQGTPSNSTGNNGLYRTTGLTVYTKKGTTTTDGTCGLQLGLSYGSGTDGNKKGEIRLFTLGTGSNYIEPATSHSSTYYNYLPTHSGTIQVQPINLYYNASGTSGNVTLSETAANYKFLEIFYKYDDDTTRSSLKIQAPNERKFQITTSYDSGTYLYISRGTYSISGTTITKDSEIRWRFGTSGNPTRTNATSSGSDIFIYRVDGIRVN